MTMFPDDRNREREWVPSPDEPLSLDKEHKLDVELELAEIEVLLDLMVETRAQAADKTPGQNTAAQTLADKLLEQPNVWFEREAK